MYIEDERGYLEENEYVKFPNGDLMNEYSSWSLNWDKKKQSFYRWNVDGREYSNEIVIKEKKKRAKKFVPSAKTCTVEIHPDYETEKAYAVFAGDNGCVVKSNRKVYYSFVAKSICYVDENGKIFKPVWAE